jgi:hypothetical protein
MSTVPRWFRPVAIVALLWNLLGCAAFLADLRLTPEDIAKLSSAQQAMYAARPVWSITATAIAVFAGTFGCIGLLIRKRWAFLLLVVSLLGVIAQDVGLFGIANAGSGAGLVPVILQSIVLAVAIGLALLARNGIARSWLA